MPQEVPGPVRSDRRRPMRCSRTVEGTIATIEVDRVDRLHARVSNLTNTSSNVSYHGRLQPTGLSDATHRRHSVRASSSY